MNSEKARWEFRELIKRCSCSRAARSVQITKEDSEALKKEGYIVKPSTAKCTPAKCYPELYSLLYPQGGCPAQSHATKETAK